MTEQVQTLKISNSHYAYDKDRGIAPVFTWELRRRQRNLEACNVIIVGEAGSGKSDLWFLLGLSLGIILGLVTCEILKRLERK